MEKPSLTPSTSSISTTYTPIWDYDRFPVEPCFRDRNARTSQEQASPFLIDYSQHYGPQSNSSRGDMIRSPSSTSSNYFTSTNHHKLGDSSRYSSRHGSRHGSRNISDHDHDLGNSIFTPNTTIGVSLSKGSPSLSPTFSSLDHNNNNNYFSGNHYDNDNDYGDITATSNIHADADNLHNNTKATTTLSKFDLYKAQTERLRSPRVSSTTSPSSNSTSRGSTILYETLPTTTTTTHESALPSVSTSKNSKRQLLPKFLKKSSKSKSSLSSIGHSSQSLSSSKSSLLMEKQPSSSSSVGVQSAPLANLASITIDTENINFVTNPEKCETNVKFEHQKTPLEEQRDHWRDEWLRPSGAIHSMFRDRPSKFDCPHCGAIKVVSNIQFTPGVMTYLVAFGLLFLTLGTCSYVPFRKNHEGTKDCIHWCPECEQKVARFNRANATWEWI